MWALIAILFTTSIGGSTNYTSKTTSACRMINGPCDQTGDHCWMILSCNGSAAWDPRPEPSSWQQYVYTENPEWGRGDGPIEKSWSGR